MRISFLASSEQYAAHAKRITPPSIVGRRTVYEVG